MESFSGIRGVHDDGLNEQVAIRYIYAFSEIIKKKYNKKKLKIIVGTDTRPSREILKDAILESLTEEVTDLGIASTPMTEFCVRHYRADCGIIITASHNEPYWNGFKFLDKTGGILEVKDMDKVINLYSKIKKLSNKEFFDKFLLKNFTKEKILSKKVLKKYEESNKKYADFVLSFFSDKEKNTIKSSKLKIVMDPNGGTGIIAKLVLYRLKVKVKGINMDYGIFNRAVEPTEDSLVYLSNYLGEGNYDFAAGFDCDADRVEIVTRNGMLSGNHLLALISDEVLKKTKKPIVVNNATSSMIKEIAKKHKVRYVETEVGETKVVSKMQSLNSKIGGEGSSSGVIINPSRCRDGILTLVYILKIIATKKKKIENLVRELPSYYNLKNKVTVSSKKHLTIRKKIIDFYKKKKHKVKVSGTEGSIKVIMKDSFVWFRTSKTEANLLRIIVDSNNKEKSEKLMEEATKMLKK